MWRGLHASAAEDDVLELAGLREVLGGQGDAVQDLVRPQFRHVEGFGGVRTDDVTADERRRVAERHRDTVAGPLAGDEQAVDGYGAATVGELGAGDDVLVALQHTRSLHLDDALGVAPLGVHRLHGLGGLGFRIVARQIWGEKNRPDDRGNARDQDDPVAAGRTVEDAHARDFTILCN